MVGNNALIHPLDLSSVRNVDKSFPYLVNPSYHLFWTWIVVTLSAYAKHLLTMFAKFKGERKWLVLYFLPFLRKRAKELTKTILHY